MRVLFRSPLGWGLLLAGILAACSSDKFSNVGSGLPLDVGQDADSVLVLLDPPLASTGAATIPVDLEEAYEDRALLYLGNRDEGQWKATPLFLVDFSQARLVGSGLDGFADFADSLVLTESVIDSVTFEVRQTRDDAKKGILRTMDLRELVGVDSLQASLLDQDLSTFLGGIVGGHAETLASSTLRIPMATSVALAHLLADETVGLALVDLTPSDPVFGGSPNPVPNSNFVALASRDIDIPSLYAEGAENPRVLAVEDLVPRLRFSLDEAFVKSSLSIADTVVVSDASIEVPVIQDMTHLQRQKASPTDLTLASYLPSRVWLDFDLVNSPVESDATINEALLTLHLRRATAIGGEELTDIFEGGILRRAIRAGSLSTQTYEVTQADAGPASKLGLGIVLNSRGSVSLADSAGTEVVVDVTDFAQRDANLLLDSSLGVMLALNLETEILNVFDFYGADAPDSLRPRLDLRFTPPADFWE